MRVTIFGQEWEYEWCPPGWGAAALGGRSGSLGCLLVVAAACLVCVGAGRGQDAPKPAATTPAAAEAAPAQTPAPVQAPAPASAGTPVPAPAPATLQSVPDQPGVPASASPLSAEEARRYVIGADDGLMVTVWKEPTLTGSLMVRPDGMVSLPLVGDVSASGKTPMGLAEEITARLKKFINDPLVTVSILTVNSKRIFLLGEVGHVGQLPITPGMTPLQAIAAAGGITPYANAKHIYILRTVAGKQQKIPFNYRKAIKDGNQQGVELVPGDTIVVP